MSVQTLPEVETTSAPTTPDPSAPVGPSIVGSAAAAAIATAGAAVALGTLFDGALAAVVGAIGAIAGAGAVAWSLGGRRGAIVQWLLLPAALLAGALVALAGGTGGATLPALVGEALFSGGLAQPPIPFDPGWRFLFVLTTVLLGAGAAQVGAAWARPNLGVAVAAPVVALAAVAQPADAGSLPVTAGLLGVVGGLVVAYGVEVARQDGQAGLQPRRLVRGAAAMGALAVALTGLAQVADGLLPEPTETRVIPPQRPPVSPPGEDLELFTVQSSRPLPWRLGVLDVYEDEAWKTPPFDLGRFEDLGAAGAVGSLGADAVGAEALTVTFRASTLSGRVLPGLAAPTQVTTADGLVTIDPRTSALRFERLLGTDVTWTVHAPPPASGEALAAAGPPDRDVAAFVAAPPPPPEVASLLASAPGAAGSFAKLQALRQVWYDTVIAAGPGDPVDVAPSRVAAILRGDGGSEASPWEIVAGEALLARWAGVPARLGYGWFGGDAIDGGYSVRPRHGAVWLEAHFEGSGWVPLVGKPPRAKGSLRDAPKNEDAAVRPTDELALITYVPIQRQNVTLLFEVVRYWVARIVPVVLLVVLAIVFLPVPRRALRRRRWARRARRHGPAAQILAHYAAMRDRAWDLNIGRPAQTPLVFADAVQPDDEHRELAWLVTRALWGDLRRSLTTEHVEAVRIMSASVTRRLVGAHPGSARLVAAASRSSIRQPYAAELHQATRVRRNVRTPWRRRAAALATLALLLAACGEAVDLRPGADADVLPAVLVPGDLGTIAFRAEPEAEVAFTEAGETALVDFGHVFSVRDGDTIEASLQVVALRPGAVDRFDDVRDGLLAALGGGRFEPLRLGDDSVLTAQTTEQRLLLWFAPGGDWYQLLVARRSFTQADAVFAAVLATQRGQDVVDLDDLGEATRVDERRGLP